MLCKSLNILGIYLSLFSLLDCFGIALLWRERLSIWILKDFKSQIFEIKIVMNKWLLFFPAAAATRTTPEWTGARAKRGRSGGVVEVLSLNLLCHPLRQLLALPSASQRYRFIKKFSSTRQQTQKPTNKKENLETSVKSFLTSRSRGGKRRGRRNVIKEILCGTSKRERNLNISEQHPRKKREKTFSLPHIFPFASASRKY